MESDKIRDMELEALKLTAKQTKTAIDIRELEIEISFEKRQFQREINHTESINDIRISLESIAEGI